MSFLDKLPVKLPETTLQYLAIGIPTALSLLLATEFTIMGLFGGKNHMPVAGRNVIMTGASAGMGKAAALILAAQGANICIIARDMKKLEAAKDEVQAVIDANGSKYPNQKVAIVSADLSSATSARVAVLKAESLIGETEILWCVAGTSKPRLFAEIDPADLSYHMTHNYYTSVYTAHAVLQLMVNRPPPPSDLHSTPKRMIIFTSTLAVLCPVVGFGAYVASKAALRALADSLRQECLLYDISVHCCCPGTMSDTPGFEQENIGKPFLTQEIEKGDVFQTAAEAAQETVKELQNGQTLPVTNLQARLARAGIIGPTPRSGSMIIEVLLSWLATIVFIFVRRDQDSIVLKEKKAKGLPWVKKD